MSIPHLLSTLFHWFVKCQIIEAYCSLACIVHPVCQYFAHFVKPLGKRRSAIDRTFAVKLRALAEIQVDVLVFIRARVVFLDAHPNLVGFHWSCSTASTSCTRASCSSSLESPLSALCACASARQTPTRG